jgi:hypothetical protein
MATEKRLIDAKEGKKVFVALARPAEYKGVIHMVVPISEIDRLPTVDAVEVVRCKDCKHYMLWEDSDENKTCAKLIGLMVSDPEDFCSYGERNPT